VVVSNDVESDLDLESFVLLAGGAVVGNRNRGGLAGGFNAGIDRACGAGAAWITLLDQDSDLAPEAFERLRQPLQHWPHRRLMVGPVVRDLDSDAVQGRSSAWEEGYLRTRLLISAGTTFRASDWPILGPFHEGLFIDFLDHAWCFRAGTRGFTLLQDPRVVLDQRFGGFHPHPLCRWLGMHLYSPLRHYYGLRNLRWLCLQPEVPLDLKIKEVTKMLVKPWLWLLCEPGRLANLRSIWAGLTAPLPGPHP
jgi:rhamnosyltransferase